MRNMVDTIRHDGGMSSAESVATEPGTVHVAGHTPFFPVLQRTGDNRYAQQMVVQAKLEIGQVRDVYEQEADRVADTVMQMMEPDGIRLAEAIIQTKQSPGKGMEVASGLEARIKHLSGRGQPLPESVRAFFEPRFGYDFSMVRIHTDVQAAKLARALNARAFAVGQDVVFGAGQYAPGTAVGMRLLAHELTHVVQQTGAGIMDSYQHTLIQRTIGDGHDLESPRFAGDQVLEACFDNERLLRTRNRGPAVVKIQQALIDTGFPLPRFGADGIFGAETRVAVRRYQKAHGLAVDGIVGPITMGSLDAQFASTSTASFKKALCVGVNDYPGTSNDLHGCVNDANDWAELLSSDFGFGDNVTLLTDADATRDKILSALEDLITGAEGGDVVVFTYSGHGSWVPDQGEMDESDNRDETIYVYDGNIIDDELRAIIHLIDRDAHLTVISDSCHSGTVTRAMLTRTYDKEKEAVERVPKPRFMPPEVDMNMLIGRQMPIRRRAFYPEEDMPEVLLTGCNATEYSYDAIIGGRNNGAMSAIAIHLIKGDPNQTYRELHTNLRQYLPSQSYPQSPQLEGSDANKDRALFT